MAPEDLARAYADVAMGYNRRLPELQRQHLKLGERVDTVHGIAIASHGLISKLALRVEEIALAVKAPRTYSSGSFPAVTAPALPLEIRTKASKTGSHYLIDNDELDRLKAKFAEKEAEERGAKEALQQLQAAEEIRESRAKSTRERWAFVIAIIAAVCAAIGWALAHVSLKS